MVIAMIVAGSIIMVGNIAAYIRFIQKSSDEMLSGKHGERTWENVGLVLLIFFLVGYLGVAFFGQPDLLMAGILFFGAIFVSLALLLMYHLVNTLKARSLEIAQTILGVIDKRDPNLKGHSINVQKLSMCLYKYLPAAMKNGISPVSFEYAALLHDVGKLGVTEEILNKPGNLDSKEWIVMHEHPRIALELLQSLPCYEEIKDWILYHHERMDGQGYYGLPGEQIPMGARIIALCDTYSAITMKRAYKNEMTYEEAIRRLQDVAGTQLDADLVDIFVKIPKEEVLSCAPYRGTNNLGE